VLKTASFAVVSYHRSVPVNEDSCDDNIDSDDDRSDDDGDNSEDDDDEDGDRHARGTLGSSSISRSALKRCLGINVIHTSLCKHFFQLSYY
jgi:hypothetical protein